MSDDLFSEGCIDCGRGFCEFCQSCGCCEVSENIRSSTNGSTTIDRSDTNEGDLSGQNNSETTDSISRGRGRPIKDPGDISDAKSTGRKRAALLYPIMSPNDPCDWKGLANCGGGKHPIIGCISGKQKHRHHGPDKNPLRNEQGNVHKICHDCHNIWHSQNDKDYDPSIKHNPRPASKDELVDRLTKVTYFAKDSEN